MFNKIIRFLFILAIITSIFIFGSNICKNMKYNNTDIKKLMDDLINIGKQSFIDELYTIREFNADERNELKHLSFNELKRAKSFLNIEGREKQFDIYDIVKLAKLDNEEVNDVLIENPNTIIIFDSKSYTNLDNGNDYYICDKTGKFEHVFRKNITNDITKMTIIDKKLRIKEEINYRGNIDNILSETLIYYDDNYNVIKTVTIKKNSNTGVLNAFEKDKNGNIIPTQLESFKQKTGSRIIRRHLISPDGYKTEYYCEEDKNLKVINYKIIDKLGNNLVNVHQTFEKISKDKYISSINTTDNKENIQIYEMKYTKDDKIKIFDNKNNKINVINLKQIFSNEESKQKLLPIIKNSPGHLLLKLSQKPIKIEYEDSNYYSYNGSWYEGKIIIGNFTDTIDKEFSLLSTFMHEYGHYLDLYQTDSPNYSQNHKLMKIYKEEFKTFQKTTTLIQQKHVEYLTTLNEERAPFERLADVHEIMYGSDCSIRNMRRLYFIQYFPRTIGETINLLLKEKE